MKRWMWMGACSLAVASAACNESTGPNGGSTPTRSDIVVLNSVSKTIQQFNVGDGQLVKFGSDIVLPANFDGDSMDGIQDLWVTTTSAFGGSQIIFGALSTGEQVVSTFPGLTGPSADAGKPTVIVDAGGIIGALVPARARDAVYLAFPTGDDAIQLAANVGTFIVRVLPAGFFLLSIDANLDDEGGSFAPLGPPRLVLHEFDDGAFFNDLSLDGATGATEALALGDDLALLAGGSFDPVTFAPEGDGALVIINVPDQGVQSLRPLGGNGVSMEPGKNGLLYIVRTKGSFAQTDVLTFNFSTKDWEAGPGNPLQPKDSDGSDLSCWVVTAFLNSDILCATFDGSAAGRLVLLEPDGSYVGETPIGVGATDIILR